MPNREREQLAQRLRSLREQERISGSRLARQLGWVQPRVSRLETGKQLPTDKDIDAWVAALGADRAVADELRQLMSRARIEYATWKDSYRSARGTTRQAAVADQESRATRVGEFQPALIPGLLQTAAYAREMLSLPCGPLEFGADQDDLEGMVAKRVERQQILYQAGKRVQIVMLEAALRSRLCSAQTLVGQLDRLIAVSGLANLELGIVPFETEIPVWPIASFTIYDVDAVVGETITGKQRLDEPNEVATYDKFFDLLRHAAVTGPDAAAVVRRALDSIPPS